MFGATDYWDNRAFTEIDISVENNIADVTPPSLDAFCPLDGDVLKGEVDLRLSASDAQSGLFRLTIEMVQFQSNKTVAFFESDNSATQHPWDSRSVADGEYTIRYRAVDNAGNEKSRIVAIEVDNIDDDSQEPAPEYRLSKKPDFSTHNENFENDDVLYLEAWDPVVDDTQMKRAVYTLKVATYRNTGHLENRGGVFFGEFDFNHFPIQGAPQEGEIQIELEDNEGRLSMFSVFFLLWPVF